MKIPDLSSPPAYTNSNLGHFYNVVPVKDQHSLKFVWVLPNLEPFHYTSPLSYHSFILGHEGPNSLLSALINEDLATGLSAGPDHVLSSYTNFYLDVSLTEKGVQESERVAEMVFSMLKEINEAGPDE